MQEGIDIKKKNARTREERDSILVEMKKLRLPQVYSLTSQFIYFIPKVRNLHKVIIIKNYLTTMYMHFYYSLENRDHIKTNNL